MANEDEKEFVGNVLGLMVLAGIIGGPCLLVAWVIVRLMIGILF